MDYRLEDGMDYGLEDGMDYRLMEHAMELTVTIVLYLQMLSFFLIVSRDHLLYAPSHDLTTASSLRCTLAGSSPGSPIMLNSDLCFSWHLSFNFRLDNDQPELIKFSKFYPYTMLLIIETTNGPQVEQRWPLIIAWK